MQPGWCQPVRQEFMENECKALPGVAYPGVRDNRSTLNTKTGYDDDDDCGLWKRHNLKYSLQDRPVSRHRQLNKTNRQETTIIGPLRSFRDVILKWSNFHKKVHITETMQTAILVGWLVGV